MPTYWQGNKKVSKATYDATQAKNTAWVAEYKKVGLDAMQPTTRQSSGKQPTPVAAANPLGIIDVRKNLEDYLVSPEGIAAADAAKRLVSTGKQPTPVSAVAFTPDYTLISAEGYQAPQVPYAWKSPDISALKEKAAGGTHGKEIVFEFSKPVTSKANAYVSKLVKLLGGKRSYIENQTKLVVVM